MGIAMRTAAVLAVVLAVAAPARAVQPVDPLERLTRVSVAADGGDAGGDSLHPRISADGRFVVFESAAENLVAGDANGKIDIFVVDRLSGRTDVVSVSSDDASADGHSSDPDISADGRFVTFMSEAGNLVPGDTNATWDVFVRDRAAATTTRASVASDGAQGDDASLAPTISADGSRVAFSSDAANLGAAPGNGGRQVYVHDRATATTTLASTNADGEQADLFGAGSAEISPDGRYVVFGSTATNLDGGVETNLNGDVFLKDLVTGDVERISVATDGTPGNELSVCPSVSRDATAVAFASRAANLVPADANGAYDYFVRDRISGRTERINVGDGGAESVGMTASWLCPLSISDDGRYVAFETTAGDLVAGDGNANLDVFVHDRVTAVTERVSLAADGAESAGSSHNAAVSADGRFVAFQGNGDDLVAGDGNGAGDIFVFDRGPRLGVGGVRAGAGAGGTDVEGWVNADGGVAAAALDEGDPQPRLAGADLTGVAVAHRPESDALAFTWAVEDLPGVRGNAVPIDGTPLARGVTAVPAVLYGARFRAGGTTYLVVGGRSADAPLVGFALYACEGTCVERADLVGSVGTTGEEARAVLPLALLGRVSRLDDVDAFTALGQPGAAAGGATWLDRRALGDVPVAPLVVAVGAGDESSSPYGVTFEPVAREGDVFRATLLGAAGARRIWARACHATACGYAVAVLAGE